MKTGNVSSGVGHHAHRQIEEFVEDFESALSEMNGESSLTSVPFPLCESTQRRLNELLVKMDGETVEDSETEEVEDSCNGSSFLSW